MISIRKAPTSTALLRFFGHIPNVVGKLPVGRVNLSSEIGECVRNLRRRLVRIPLLRGGERFCKKEEFFYVRVKPTPAIGYRFRIIRTQLRAEHRAVFS